MKTDTFNFSTNGIGWYLFLISMQILVFNHIHLFGYSTPLPYIYFLLILPANTARWKYLLAGFLIGLPIDILGNTPGVAMISMTFMGLIVPILFRLFGPKESDDKDHLRPSITSMEIGPFLRYAFSACLLFCFTFFGIEAFNLSNESVLLLNALGSTLLTFLFVLAIELLRKH